MVSLRSHAQSGLAVTFLLITSLAHAAVIGPQVQVVDDNFNNFPIPVVDGQDIGPLGYFVQSTSLTVDNGSTLAGGRFITMNDASDPSAPIGRVDIDGPGSTINIVRGATVNPFSHLDIGSQGQSVVNITNGGKLISTRTPGACAAFQCFHGQLTNAAGSQLDLTVSGAGSEFTTVSDTTQVLHIGKAVVTSFGFGTPGGTSNANVRIENQGTFNTGFAVVGTSAASDANTGNETANGVVRVDGTGSTWNAADIAIAFPAPASAPLRPQNSGLVVVSNGAEINTSNVFVGSNGILAGNGTVNGTIDNRGGLVAPGLSPGMLTINGDFIMSDGTLHLEIAGTTPGMFDSLDVSGIIDITGGTILFDFINNFVPAPSDLLGLLSATSINIAQEVGFQFLGVNPNAMVNFDPRTGQFGFADVPEPSAIALWVLALGLMWRGRRRLRRANLALPAV